MRIMLCYCMVNWKENVMEKNRSVCKAFMDCIIDTMILVTLFLIALMVAIIALWLYPIKRTHPYFSVKMNKIAATMDSYLKDESNG